MKSLALILVLTSLAASCGKPSSSSTDAFRVPDSAALVETDPRFERAIDLHLQSQEQTLLNLETAHAGRKFDSPYHLGGMMFDLGISLKGVLGQLTGKGAAAVLLLWKKEVPTKETEETEVLPPLSPLDELDWDSSVAREFTRQNHPEAAPSSDVLRHVRGLREFSAVAAQLEEAFPWKVDRLRLDLQVDASGKVVTDFSPVTLKAAAKLRLEWKKRPVSAKALGNVSPGQLRLLSEVMAALPALEAEIRREERLGFQLNSVKIGLGLGLAGEWEVVKPGVTPTLYLYLKPSPETVRAEHRVRSRLASRFARGFRTAGRMARFFVRVASRRVRPSGAWSLTDLKVGFDVSAKQTFNLTTANSTTGVELHFTKKR